MGKGTIIANTGAGQYTVQVNYNRDALAAEIARLNSRVTKLTAEIAGLDPADDAEQISLLILQRLEYEKRIVLLERLPDDPTVAGVWCTDKTEELSGEVGLIEVSGERTHGLNIQPGGNGNAVYDEVRDGALQYTLGMSPSGTVYNLAMMPGWQKWKPLYKLGTISFVNEDNDTCNLTLDDRTSSIRSIDIVDTLELTDVPIEYMDCNAEVFSEGHRVVVEFLNQDPDDPLVIGFEDTPLDCCFWNERWDSILGIGGWTYTGLTDADWTISADGELHVLGEIGVNVPPRLDGPRSAIFNVRRAAGSDISRTLSWDTSNVSASVSDSSGRAYGQVRIHYFHPHEHTVDLIFVQDREYVWTPPSMFVGSGPQSFPLSLFVPVDATSIEISVNFFLNAASLGHTAEVAADMDYIKLCIT
ncbi:hypothetical protein LCGC14_0721540 [marine sediment metagenome]|uniref:Uncharacterized protein n=1 Tax=marine sediment metagenome TaxID=412755 RepID=A0A0F9SXN3_9ZZZZ